jgi:hypothetical protein
MFLRRTLVYLGMRDDGPPTVAMSISRRIAATVAAALAWASIATWAFDDDDEGFWRNLAVGAIFVITTQAVTEWLTRRRPSDSSAD